MFCRYTTLAITYQLQRLFPQASSLALTLTYRGVFLAPCFSPCNPPRATREASLMLDLSFTKMRGVSIEVTMIGIPSCVTHLLFGLGFSQTTRCAIKFLVPLFGMILNPFRSHNDTWKVYSKSFTHIFPDESIGGKFHFHF